MPNDYKRRRNALKRTQAELAKLARISTKTLQRLEKDPARARASTREVVEEQLRNLEGQARQKFQTDDTAFAGAWSDLTKPLRALNASERVQAVLRHTANNHPISLFRIVRCDRAELARVVAMLEQAFAHPATSITGSWDKEMTGLLGATLAAQLRGSLQNCAVDTNNSALLEALTNGSREIDSIAQQLSGFYRGTIHRAEDQPPWLSASAQLWPDHKQGLIMDLMAYYRQDDPSSTGAVLRSISRSAPMVLQPNTLKLYSTYEVAVLGNPVEIHYGAQALQVTLSDGGTQIQGNYFSEKHTSGFLYLQSASRDQALLGWTVPPEP